MAIHYRTQGFFIKKTDQGEADRVFTIYTKDFGKLKILGKAIRKIKSKLRPAAELFYLSEIEFIQGKIQKTLTDTLLIDKFLTIRKNLAKLKTASRISQLLDNLVKEEEVDRMIWGLLREIFDKLNHFPIRGEKDKYKLKLIYYYFLWNLLSLLGYQPELYHCSFCQKKFKPELIYFAPSAGGIVCPNCYPKTKNGKRIEADSVKILRLILKRDHPLLLKLKIDPPIQKSLEEISQDYLNNIYNILGEIK